MVKRVSMEEKEKALGFVRRAIEHLSSIEASLKDGSIEEIEHAAGLLHYVHIQAGHAQTTLGLTEKDSRFIKVLKP